MYVKGRVTEKYTGRPIDGVEVQNIIAGTGGGPATVTSGGGWFQFRDAQPGTLVFTLFPEYGQVVKSLLPPSGRLQTGTVINAQMEPAGRVRRIFGHQLGDAPDGTFMNLSNFNFWKVSALGLAAYLLFKK